MEEEGLTVVKWYSKPLVVRVVTLSLLVFAVPAGIFYRENPKNHKM